MAPFLLDSSQTSKLCFIDLRNDATNYRRKPASRMTLDPIPNCTAKTNLEMSRMIRCLEMAAFFEVFEKSVDPQFLEFQEWNNGLTSRHKRCSSGFLSPVK